MLPGLGYLIIIGNKYFKVLFPCRTLNIVHCNITRLVILQLLFNNSVKLVEKFINGICLTVFNGAVSILFHQLITLPINLRVLWNISKMFP